MIEFEYRGVPKTALKVVTERLPLAGYSVIHKLFRKKEVRVGGAKVAANVVVNDGDTVRVYIDDQIIKPYSVVYADDNVVVVNKRAGVLVNEGEDSLAAAVKSEFRSARAVHRLDRNTTGLVVFALNNDSEQQLLDAFKLRKVEKYYIAHVWGILSPKQAELTAYLTKDSDNAVVSIKLKPTPDSRKIITAYRVLSEDKAAKRSILEVRLITGATHQIRAHLSFIGHAIIGDNKYGNAELNRKEGKHMQQLCASKIVFHFENGTLQYLDNKVVSLAE